MNENEAARVRGMLAEQEARILISQQPEFSGDELLQQVAFRKVLELAQDPNAVDRRVESAVKEACAATVEWRRNKQAELGIVRRPTEKTDAKSANGTRSNDPRRNRPAVTVQHNPDGSVAEEDGESTAAVIRAMSRARGQANPLVHYAKLPTAEE